MFSIVEGILKAMVPVVLIGMLSWHLTNEALDSIKIHVKIYEQNKVIEAIKLENIQLKQEQEDILKQFTILTSLSDEQRKDLVATKLSEKLTNTNDEISRLKEIMLQTPEKAVKLEILQTKNEAKFNVYDEKISSLKEQFNLIVNLMILFVTIIVGLLGYIWKENQRKHCNTKIK